MSWRLIVVVEQWFVPGTGWLFSWDPSTTKSTIDDNNTNVNPRQSWNWEPKMVLHPSSAFPAKDGTMVVVDISLPCCCHIYGKFNMFNMVSCISNDGSCGGFSKWGWGLPIFRTRMLKQILHSHVFMVIMPRGWPPSTDNNDKVWPLSVASG